VTRATDARARQLRGYADHLAAIAEFRRLRERDQQERINALLSEMVHALAALPLDGESWPNQFTAHPMRMGDIRDDVTCPGCGTERAVDSGPHFEDPAVRKMTCLECAGEFDIPEFVNPVPDASDPFWLESA
jgi:hypothetical protein